MTSTNRSNHVCKYLADIPAVLVYILLQNGAEQETVGIAVGDTSLQTNGAERGDG